MRNRNLLPMAVAGVLCLMALLAGCQAGIKTESVADNLPRVLDRHDAYAQAQLEGTVLADAMAGSNVVRVAFDANRNGHLPASVGANVLPVLARHDGWVRGDTTLAEVARDVYLDSSKALGLLFAPKEE